MRVCMQACLHICVYMQVLLKGAVAVWNGPKVKVIELLAPVVCSWNLSQLGIMIQQLLHPGNLTWILKSDGLEKCISLQIMSTFFFLNETWVNKTWLEHGQMKMYYCNLGRVPAIYVCVPNTWALSCQPLFQGQESRRSNDFPVKNSFWPSKIP